MGSQVLDRCALLLDAVAAGAESVGDITAYTGLPRATVHRLLRALAALNLVASDEGRLFRLGPWIPELGAVVEARGALEQLTGAVEELRARTGLGAHAYRRAGGTRECLASANRAEGLREVIPVGASYPLGCDSASLVLLAWGPAGWEGGCEAVRERLELTRRQGWAATTHDCVHTLSAPLRAPSGRVIAAVTLSGPPTTEARSKRLAVTLRKRITAVESELAARSQDCRTGERSAKGAARCRS